MESALSARTLQEPSQLLRRNAGLLWCNSKRGDPELPSRRAERPSSVLKQTLLLSLAEHAEKNARLRVVVVIVLAKIELLSISVVPEPFKGKQQVQEILKQLLLTVDAFTPKLVLEDGADFAAIFTIELGPNKLDGMDHMHINEAGFIDGMTVAWRPLPAVVEVQKLLAPKFEMKPLTLVPLTEAATE
jgi:hypothetical protein